MHGMKRLLSIFLFALVFTLCGCGGSPSQENSTDMSSADEQVTSADQGSSNEQLVASVRISAEEARQMMQETSSYILLDVRSESEFREQRIEGAVLIPNDELSARADAELPDKNTPIIVYCRSGARSAQAAESLVQMGYTNVFDMGGIINWPYETVSG